MSDIFDYPPTWTDAEIAPIAYRLHKRYPNQSAEENWFQAITEWYYGEDADVASAE